MSEVSYIIKLQHDCMQELEHLKVSLRKLNIERRTVGTVQKLYDGANIEWNKIQNNHEKLLNLETNLPEDYLINFKDSNKTMTYIQEFVEGLHPQLLQNPDNTDEAAKDYFELRDDMEELQKQETSKTYCFPEPYYKQIKEDSTKIKETTFSKKGMFNLKLDQKNDILKPKENNQIDIDKEDLVKILINLLKDKGNVVIEKPSIRTPEIELPKFTGVLKEYRQFKDTFLSVINKTNATLIEKFTILKSKLSGRALEEINILSVTENNYETAWDILDKRFNNRRWLIEENINSIIDAFPIERKNATSILKYIHTYSSAIHNLQDLEVDIQKSSEVLIVIIMKKLDDYTKCRFEDSLGNTSDMPTLKELNTFMEKEYSVNVRKFENDPVNEDKRKNYHQYESYNNRYQHEPASDVRRNNYYRNENYNNRYQHEPVYEPRSNRFEPSYEFKNYRQNENNKDRRTNQKDSSTENKNNHDAIKKHARFNNENSLKQDENCLICNDTHSTTSCLKFITSTDRVALLIQHKICIFCVKHKYDAVNLCKLRDILNCQKCGGSHITQMHPQNKNLSRTNLIENQSESLSEIILPTALANIVGSNNELTTVRCLVDQGSQSSYITEDIVQKLKLTKKKTEVDLVAVGGVVVNKAKWIVTLSIKLDDPDHPIIKTKALVVKKITNQLPACPKHLSLLDSTKNLADPKFNKPSHIPILLGSNVLPQIILNGAETKNGLLYQNTKLGWIVSGGISEKIESITSTHVTISEFEKGLISFWDMPNKEDCADDDVNACEKLYLAKQTRTPDGRYVVPTPWKDDKKQLGNSYSKAIKFFIGQEARWNRNPEHKEKSNAFMQEYLDMNHMSPIEQHQQKDESGEVFYIPYISILRKDAVTTKLRNVFNASSKSSNGVTLNDTIHPGPKMQTLIFDVITRIRQYKYIYSSDVTKMYRQILVNPEDRDKLRIIWRANKSEPLMEYRLHTITYGLDCAPWQAIRTLHQIADDNAPDNETKQIIKNSFYMDDLFHGSDTIEQCQIQISKIIKTLESGKLPLTKWVSNHHEVLKNINDEHKISAYIDFDDQIDSTVKTLGLLYNPKNDSFSFKIKNKEKIVYTKRGLLSIAASLYDPIGWILPAIIKLRILIQSLWYKKYDWDDNIDQSTKETFEQCFSSLNLLAKITIPRWTQATNSTSFQLIGFCDASQDAYAAVVYSRVLTTDGYQITIIASKGRVTPLKTKKIIDEKLCTIPKLELEAILLLAELFSNIMKCFIKTTAIVSYTDSEVALAWVRSKKELLNGFVKRRVNKIHQVIKPADIHYVKSAENPADPASRGLTSEQLIRNNLWFNGPHWLKHEILPITTYQDKEKVENEVTKISCTLLTSTNVDGTVNFIKRFSSFSFLIKVIAWCLRWKNKNKGTITGNEITTAKNKILKFQQNELFKIETKILKNKKPLPVKHWMTCLSPFYDETDDFIRVGGRISNAAISEDKKHPIMLTKCHLVDLIIRHIHLNHGHSGNSLTERLVREEYWIPSIKQRIKKCIRSCVTCVRWNARTVQPEMADLPSERVTPASIFSQVGVDLCGPFNVKASRIKFDKVLKVWVAVFVCLVSKAVHLEIVSDLSTENFLAAFARFTSRRGCPKLVMSDNGTNFIGANRKIKEGWQKIVSECQDKTAIQEITWKFIPSYSPTFGGLWEAAVKSMKYFVKRMATVESLYQEEFNTLLCRIEGILNSRPLYPNSTDCSDQPALTPFHFLAQRSMKVSPSDSIELKKNPVTKKWLLVQQIQNQFWERFNLEYLHYLQKKYKWKNPTRNIEIGDLVLLHDINSPPAVWKMGRVIESFPDNKGVSRQYAVKISNKETVQRAAKRLIPLLPEDQDEEPALRRSRRTNTVHDTL